MVSKSFHAFHIRPRAPTGSASSSLYYDPPPCPKHSVNSRNELRSTEPSNDPFTIRRRATTLWSLFHPRKPPDSHLNMYDMHHARTPPSVFGHARRVRRSVMAYGTRDRT